MSMKLSEQQQIFTRNVAKLITYANSRNIELTFGEAYRTDEQQKLYYYGKTVREEDAKLELISGKKRSQTMQSNHLRRLAVDFNFFVFGNLTFDHPEIKVLGDYWESLHPANRWGGHFKNFFDAPHFEMNV